MTRPSTVIAFVIASTINLASAAGADVVTEWNVAALDAIRASRMPPPLASRALAILHVSMYDAINGIVRTHEQYQVPSAVPASASTEAAASAAAHAALVNLFPGYMTAFDALHDSMLAAIGSGPSKDKGIAWGEHVTAQILASRANDGAGAIVVVPSGDNPGMWQPTPPAFAAYLLPQWGFVAPFGMEFSAQFRPAGPPSLDSAAYLADYNEVKAFGRATGSARSPEQDLIALFWADGAGTETPPGHWNTIARSVAAARASTPAENARLFALLNIAMADAAICAWDAKYIYDFWRPVTAIRLGDADGIAATIGDPSWTSFITTPPFPDYVSGHSTFSGAAATVLAMFYEADDIPFTTGSDFLPGLMRQFTSFSAAAAEAALSRLLGGIHFRSANLDGLQSGNAIGRWTVAHHLRPKGNRSRR